MKHATAPSNQSHHHHRTGERWGFLRMGVAVLAMMAAAPAMGQITSLSNPQILERALEEPEGAKAPAPSLRLPEGTSTPEGAGDLRFTLKGLSIKGGETFDVATITSLAPPETGTDISLSDLYDYADRITQYYRQEGYALSFALVPAQEVTNGLVRIEIIEGRIDELVIRERNLSQLARGHILDAFARFAEKGLTRTGDLEALLLSINRFPGISAKGVIRPGDRQGSSTLVLEVTQRTQTASLGYQNYLSESLGRDVFLSDVALLGQWTGRDEARLSLRQAPDPHAYRSIAFDYKSYIDDTDLEVFVKTSQSKTKPKKGPLADLDFRSSAYSQEFGLSYPVWQRRKSSLFAGGSVRVTDSQSHNGNTPATTDKVRAVTVYADYESDLADGATQLFHIEIEQGAKFFHARANSRENANLHHTILRISERYRHPLQFFEIGQVDATLRLLSQVTISDDPVFANSECSFGGRGYGIGMDAGTLSGEHCLLASAQLNWQRPLVGFAFLPPSLFTLLGRIDAGTVRQKGPLAAGESRQQEAISAAIGGQFVMASGMTVNIEQSTQLKNEDTPTKEGESSTHISVNMRF
ncbi:MAG: ShlB/FhaC/HecB family hemolysin secretion/activation protein [Candidatus Puniceispirillaceae bacterium]